MARTSDTERPADGITAFLLDAGNLAVKLGRPEK
jgi:hypothetical protein